MAKVNLSVANMFIRGILCNFIVCLGYLTGILNKEQTLEALKIRKLFNQLVFASEKALSYLVFKGCEQV